ncbi:hypothetical protein MML48_9g00021313 [Holotrichia oblita]|uniref:Uncharacterized protein n=1 Tax=Holotrichia oblita TaxID=644536 RepID=A0ACB9SH83_HOLOL|nr:hypothetical protein MML48_9g00021313 [Holotrichia oblita]
MYNSVSPKKINDISGKMYRHSKDNSRSRKLSSVCLPNENDHSSAESQVIEVKPKEKASCYSCKNYQQQVTTLSTKILDLDKELHENKEKMTNLNEEIDKIKVNLAELDVVKQKLRDIEEKIEKKLSSSTGAIPSPPPPPPPIPPPPPPLPSSASSPSVSRTVKATVARKVEKKNCENSRPVISLNDILNVKLKKTSDKPRLTRRATQPFVSVEMLRQIKLRPASRSQTPVSIKDVSTPSSLSSSSPASNLTKLLTNADPNMRRLKRLRRSSRYSFDDSRKLLLRRERNNVDDS